MSFWDDLTGIFNGVTSGDWSGAGQALSQGVTDTGTALSGLGSSIGQGLSNVGSTVGSGLSGLASDVGSALPSVDASNVPSVGGSTGSDVGSYGGSGVGLQSPMSYMGVGSSADSGAGSGMPDSGISAGAEAAGGASTTPGNSATDWLKNNRTLGNLGVNALGTLLTKNTPAPASQTGFDQANAANTARSAIGTSMVNQAPFMANNMEANAKLAGANAEGALSQRLAQQGYTPGTPMYESMMAQQKLGDASNANTAYAAGQGQMGSAMTSGAGLMTPNLSGYSALAGDQNAQQNNQNKQTQDLAGVASKAFDAWANPTTPPKNSSSTDGTDTSGNPG